MELKELKCTNCGATVKVEEGKKTVTCKFCHTTFSVENHENTGYEFEKGRIKAQKEEAENLLNDNENLNTIRKAAGVFSIIHGIFYVIFIIIFLIAFVTVFKSINDTRKSMDDSYEEIIDEEVIEEEDNDAYSFNFYFFKTNGSKTLFQLKNVLDDIITNNKTNDRLITVIYNDTKTSNPDEIKTLKNSLKENKEKKYDYELSYNYDDDGYIIEAVIEDYTGE